MGQHLLTLSIFASDPEKEHLRSVSARPAKRILRFSLLTVGLGLLFYVGSQYWMMFHEQRRLQLEWQKQSAPSPAAPAPAIAKASDALTRLQITKIDLDAVVVEGTRRRQLAVAPGHLTGTPAPGDSGNAVVTAHRDTFFRHIYELQKGDTILVQRNGKTFTFEVTGKKIVEPEDVSVIAPSEDARLTLITCYPTYYIGPAPERLVVFSKLTNPEANDSTPATTSSAPSASTN